MAGTRLYSTEALHTMGGGNKEFIHKMCLIFIAIVPEGIDKIEMAWAVGDIKTVFQYAHKIKSNINHLGVVSIKEDLLKIEMMAREEKVDAILMDALILKVRNTIDEVVGQIKEDCGV